MASMVITTATTTTLTKIEEKNIDNLRSNPVQTRTAINKSHCK